MIQLMVVAGMFGKIKGYWKRRLDWMSSVNQVTIGDQRILSKPFDNLGRKGALSYSVAQYSGFIGACHV